MLKIPVQNEVIRQTVNVSMNFYRYECVHVENGGKQNKVAFVPDMPWKWLPTNFMYLKWWLPNNENDILYVENVQLYVLCLFFLLVLHLMCSRVCVLLCRCITVFGPVMPMPPRFNHLPIPKKWQFIQMTCLLHFKCYCCCTLHPFYFLVNFIWSYSRIEYSIRWKDLHWVHSIPT